MSGLMSVRYVLNENILICSLRDRTCPSPWQRKPVSFMLFCVMLFGRGINEKLG